MPNEMPLGGPMQRTEEVQELQQNGCSILCLDCPEGMLFGIDYAAWSVGPSFMGVKLVPPGLHYIYCSASASEDVGISRSGFFLLMKSQDVVVFRWDPETEELARPDNADEESRYADGVRGFDFDAQLGPYPLELRADWSELTRHASGKLLAKIEPVSKVVRSKRAEYDAIIPSEASRSVAETEAAGKAAEEAAADGGVAMADQGEVEDTEMKSESQEQKQQQTAEEAKADMTRVESNTGSGNMFFSAVPRGRKIKGMTPVETTQLHMDRSAQLEQMITREYGGSELGILGELQLAYIAFLLGQNYDGFEQWRALLQLLCTCETAVARHPELFSEFCRAFFAQLSQAPSDLFGDDLTSGNFMGACVMSLLELCDTDEAPPKLRKRCGKLRELVEQKFGISIDDLALLGEDAPQIVEEDGRDLVDLSGPRLGELD